MDCNLNRTVREELESSFKDIQLVSNKLIEIENEMKFLDSRKDSKKLDYLVNQLSKYQEKFEILGGYQMQAEVEKILPKLGFSQEDADRLVGNFSGGWQMKVALGKIILQKPDLLLLDEPTNHLDAESVMWLEQHLAQYNGTVIAITHDRYFLDNVAGWILELDRGEGIPWKGNYSSWLEQKAKRLKQEEKLESKRQKTLERELDWVRMNPKGRRSKSKSRLSNYEKLLTQEGKEKEEKIELYIPPGPRLGNNVINAEGVSKAYGDKLLYENLDFKLPPAGIVGVVGANGAGKTTLFRMIMNQETPDKGYFRIGETVKIAYVDQQHIDIDIEKTIWEQITGGQEQLTVGGILMNSRAYVAKFNFNGSDQNKKIGEISGGERNRLHLAMTLRQDANVLLLDEPTNDLDINTLRALEEGLDNFAGCAVIISHDRWFLDRVCTHILAFEGDSKVVYYEGGYSDYEDKRKKRLGDISPKRIKYRKLTRD